MSYEILIYISIFFGAAMGLAGCWLINFIFIFAEKNYYQAVRILCCIICYFSCREMLNFLDELGRKNYPDDIVMQGLAGVIMMVSLFGMAVYIEKKGTARWVKYMNQKNKVRDSKKL